AIGISLGSVQRIWRAHKLQPHRLGVSEISCKRNRTSFVLSRQRADGSKRSPNRMANCPTAAVHSIGLRQCTPALRIARKRSLSAASSVGKLPRVLMVLLNDRGKRSAAFVV